MKFILEKDKFKIENQNSKNKLINSGSINYYLVDVEHDDAWNGLNIAARIVSRKGTGVSRAVVNNQIYIDKKISESTSIGFVGYRIENEKKTYQISTNFLPLPYNKGAGEVDDLDDQKESPTPSQWEIYLSQVQEFIDNGNEILEDAEDKIEDMTEA